MGQIAYKAYLLSTDFPDRVATHPIESLRFLFRDPECTNFTYEIANHAELVRFMSGVLGIDESVIRRYSDELRNDGDLSDRLRRKLIARRDRKDNPLYGRRVGWYCVVRARK